MPLPHWDTALTDLMNSDEAEQINLEWGHEEAFTIAASWLTAVDAANDGEIAAKDGIDCPEFTELCDAIAAGILLALKGASPIRDQAMVEINEALGRFKRKLLVQRDFECPICSAELGDNK